MPSSPPASLRDSLHAAANPADRFLWGAEAGISLDALRHATSLRGRLPELAGRSVLVATAAALYYAGSDTLRSVAADVHIAIGLAFPVLIVTHIVLGRRNRARDPARDLAVRTRSRPLEMPGGLRPVTFSEDPGSR